MFKPKEKVLRHIFSFIYIYNVQDVQEHEVTHRERPLMPAWKYGMQLAAWAAMTATESEGDTKHAW